jgi:hypothetical protein
MGALALAVACDPNEPPEVARERVTERLLVQQNADLRALIQKAEAGDLVTTNRMAIGIAENVAQSLLNASLPQEKKVAEHLLVRLESAQALFRGNSAVLLFRAQATGLRTGATAHIELAGRLANMRIEDGKLVASIEVAHFDVIDTSLGRVAADAIEALVRDNLEALGGLLPPFEIPVHLEQSIKIGGLDEGIVVAKAGALPLVMTVAETLPVNERLWILLDVQAGPWTSAPAPRPTP